MIISLFNSKGGCGKTTSVMYIAQELDDRGYKVSVWDADPQRSATEWWQEAQSLPFTVTPHDLTSLKHVKDPQNEIVLIDCPPGGSQELMVQVVKLTDFYIVPMKCGMVDVSRALKTLKTLKGEGKPAIPLITMVNKRTKSYKEVVDMLGDTFPSWFGGMFKRKTIPAEFCVRNLETYSERGYQSITDTKDYKDVVDHIEKEWIND